MVLKGDALFIERTVNLPVAIVAVVLGLNGGDSFHDFMNIFLSSYPFWVISVSCTLIIDPKRDNVK